MLKQGLVLEIVKEKKTLNLSNLEEIKPFKTLWEIGEKVDSHPTMPYALSKAFSNI